MPNHVPYCLDDTQVNILEKSALLDELLDESIILMKVSSNTCSALALLFLTQLQIFLSSMQSVAT